MARLEAESPTTDFQWPGAPAPSGKRWTAAEIASENAEITEQVELAEAHLGVTADTASLRGRLAIRAKAYDEAIRQMDLARLLDADGANPRRLVEWGLAYGVRGRAENRAYDVMLGLDKLLRARETGKFGPGEFEDLALLAGDIPAPSASAGFWKEALQRADARDKSRLGKALAGEREIIDGRQRRINQVLGTRRASRDIPGSTELLLQVALAEWIGDREHHEEDLRALAAAFLDIHRDPVVRDLIGMPSSREAERALMEAAAANRAGEYSKAVAVARAAIESYRRLGNPAGSVLAANESLYARWLTQDTSTCEPWWLNLTVRNRYEYAHLRATLESNTCFSTMPGQDVLARREAFVTTAAHSTFPGLAARAIATVVEPAHSDTSPERAWDRAKEGLLFFWKSGLPATVAGNYYNPMHVSAEGADAWRVAELTLNEAILLLTESANLQRRSLFVRLLEELRARNQPVLSFGRVVTDAPVPKAARELALHRPDLALVTLERLSGGQSKFPYQQLERYARLQLLPVLGNALWDLGRRAEALKHLRACADESAAWARAVNRLEQRELRTREARACWGMLAELQLKKGDIRGSLETWQTFRNLRHQAGWSERNPEAGEVWISIAHLPHQWVVWVLDGNGLTHNLTADPYFEAKASRFASLAATRTAPIEAVNRAGEDLAGALWGPLRVRVERAKIALLDAEGSFALVPWAALPRASGGIFADRTAAVQMLGWSGSGGQKIHSWDPALIVSTPYVPQALRRTFPQLPSSDQSLEAARSAFPAAVTLHDAEASPVAVAKRLQSSRIFHFFGHGVASGGSSGLLLSSLGDQPTVMSGSVISKLYLGSLELAVLTACSSGAVATPGVVNLEGLSEAFLSAGAKRVVSTRWNVDASSTGKIVADAYFELARGTSVAEAFRIAVAAAHSREPHPWYWAGLQQFGEP